MTVDFQVPSRPIFEEISAVCAKICGSNQNGQAGGSSNCNRAGKASIKALQGPLELVNSLVDSYQLEGEFEAILTQMLQGEENLALHVQVVCCLSTLIYPGFRYTATFRLQY